MLFSSALGAAVTALLDVMFNPVSPPIHFGRNLLQWAIPPFFTLADN